MSDFIIIFNTSLVIGRLSSTINVHQLSMTCVAELGTSLASLLFLSSLLSLSLVDSSQMVDATPKPEPEPEPNSRMECQSKPKLGYTYMGETSTTVSGKQCRLWSQVRCTEDVFLLLTIYFYKRLREIFHR